MKVLFVCLGNICRSPTAEAVMRHMAAARGIDVEVDSAGTAAYHIGKAPDDRSQSAASKRGVLMSSLHARQAMPEDFLEFDYVFAMDRANYQHLDAISQSITDSSSSSKAELILFLEEYGTMDYDEVPDPYYGAEDGFERVLDLLEDACDVFLKKLKPNNKNKYV